VAVSTRLLNQYTYYTELLKWKTVRKEMMGKRVSFEAIPKNSECWSWDDIRQQTVPEVATSQGKHSRWQWKAMYGNTECTYKAFPSENNILQHDTVWQPHHSGKGLSHDTRTVLQIVRFMYIVRVEKVLWPVPLAGIANIKALWL